MHSELRLHIDNYFSNAWVSMRDRQRKVGQDKRQQKRLASVSSYLTCASYLNCTGSQEEPRTAAVSEFSSAWRCKAAPSPRDICDHWRTGQDGRGRPSLGLACRNEMKFEFISSLDFENWGVLRDQLTCTDSACFSKRNGRFVVTKDMPCLWVGETLVMQTNKYQEDLASSSNLKKTRWRRLELFPVPSRLAISGKQCCGAALCDGDPTENAAFEALFCHKLLLERTIGNNDVKAFTWLEMRTSCCSSCCTWYSDGANLNKHGTRGQWHSRKKLRKVFCCGM